MNILLSLGYVCSTSGYFMYFCKKMNYHFAPLFTISTITLIVYIAGLLKILFPVSILLYALGIVLMIYFIKKRMGKLYTMDFTFKLMFSNRKCHLFKFLITRKLYSL